MQLQDLRSLQQDDDEAVRAEATTEAQSLRSKRGSLTRSILKSLLPSKRDDCSDVVLEVRAGAGGDEAALFAGDLFKMYELLAGALLRRPRAFRSRAWPLQTSCGGSLCKLDTGAISRRAHDRHGLRAPDPARTTEYPDDQQRM